MRHCFGETVQVHEDMDADLSKSLARAAVLVKDHEGTANVVATATSDPDTGDFTYITTVYLHG
jgi:hypothetical protein